MRRIIGEIMPGFWEEPARLQHFDTLWQEIITRRHERALCQVQHIKRMKKSVEVYEFQLAALPDLTEMQASSVEPPVSTSSSTAREVKKAFDNRRTWTDVNLSAQSTPHPPSLPASPTVDLSRGLGYSAHYADRDDEEKNTLFRFQATTEIDIRYVFIPPHLEGQIEAVQWQKFMTTACYARLASKTNQQGIKTLEGNHRIKDPSTGKDYPALELKILGAEGSGGIRLLGAMIPI